MNTGLRIKNLREYRNYTQTYLADELGISQNALSKIESGATKLTMERIEGIAKILDVPVENILDSESPVFNIENNHSEKFYIQNLHEESKEAMQQTINILKEEVAHLQNQNEALLRTITALGGRGNL